MAILFIYIFSEARSLNMSRTMKSSLFLFIALYIFSCVIFSKIPKMSLFSAIGEQTYNMIEETIVSF